MFNIHFFAILLLLHNVIGNDDSYYYSDDPDYEYEYVYEADDDCLDADEDGYCDEPVEYLYDDDEDAPMFGEDTTHVKVDLGNTARITCSVHNLGSRVISWKRGDSFLFLGSSSLIEDKRYSVSTEVDSSTLTITLFKYDDAGDFTCQVATQDMMEQKFTIEIKAPPNVRILNKPESGKHIVQEGDQLKLECQGEGDPAPSLTWKRLNLQLPPGLTMPHSDTLMFPSITQSDAGAYQCVANNGFGHPATDTITVLVKHKPKIYVSEEYEINKETDQIELLKLICSVQAYPRAITQWKRNDKNLGKSRVTHKHEDGRHILQIARPRQSDIGVYTCDASNEMGKMFAVLNIENNHELPDIDEENIDVHEMVADQSYEDHSSTANLHPNFLVTFILTFFLLKRQFN